MWKLRLNGRIQKQKDTVSDLFTTKSFPLVVPNTSLVTIDGEILPKQNALKQLKTSENCLPCGLFSVCKDPQKGRDYWCSAYTTDRPKSAFNIEGLVPSGMYSNIPQTINKSGSYSDLEKVTISNNDELEDLLEKITSQFKSGIIRDLKIDDSDIPLAKNYVDFYYNPRFVGSGQITYPFAKQTEMAINLLSEWCPNPKCSNAIYAKNIPVDATIDQILEQITMLEYGICPKCKGTRYEFWHNPEYKYKRFANMIGIAGQRSGKTAGVNRINGYMFHRWLKLNRPQRVFSIEENVWVETCFTATTFGKALENFYDPLVNTLRNNKWFKEYHEMLDYHSGKLGQEMYKILGETTFYNHRNYILYPKSPDPSNLRGSTRNMAEIDELSHLWAKNDDAKKLNPKEVHNSLSNSLVTLRMAYNKLVRRGYFDIPPPLMCNITSPRSMGDYGMQLLRLSQDEISNTYGWHYNVYEMNPHAKDDEELEQIKRERPDDFKRDFMAIPPSAANAFIEDKAVVKAAVGKHPNGITNFEQGPVRSHAKNVKLMSASYDIRKSSKVDTLKSYKVLALDAGTRFNSFAFAIGHLDLFHHPQGYDEIKRVFDVVGEIIPENDHTISIAEVYNTVINPLIDDFNIIHLSADRWNSAKLLQDASTDYEHLQFKQYSCKMKDFVEFRTGLISGDIKIPLPEITLDEAFSLSAYNYPQCFKGKPVAHCMLQMLTVENYIKSVEKGGKFTDDIFRAMVLANHFLTDPVLYEELLAPTDPVADTDMFIGAYANTAGNVIGISGSTIGTSNRSASGSVGGIGSIVSLPGFGR